MCRHISDSKRRNLLLMSIFAVDALTVSPLLHALCYGVTRRAACGTSPDPQKPGRACRSCFCGILCIRDQGQPVGSEPPCPGSSAFLSGTEPGPLLDSPEDKTHPCHQWGQVACRAHRLPHCSPFPLHLTVSLGDAFRITMSTTPPWPAARPTQPGSRGCDPGWCTWCRCEPAL